ncbi:polysaccharide lyase family 7 protein [Vibrio hippocampi]|uniref:Alginate lyase 2 domain-containing protein n=1 Tax=Vibrio hippocampi TaxID=654686 RepID=A0ABN8DIX0_9VIBR|nr:polysaccharide lyase family 7 protein [Vibrio hippocampi]CAH0528731.1 hypothetical protein VHP8226_02757 [Vibrio hippocampi]
MKKKYLAGAISLACLFVYGCGGSSDGGSSGGGDDSEIVIDGNAESVEELQAELEAATDGDTITLSGDFSSTEPVTFTLDKSITLTGSATAASSSSDGKAVISGNVCFDVPDSADGHGGITLSNLHFEDIEMEESSDGQSCGSESASRSIINIGKVGTGDTYVTLENLSFDGSGFDELTGNPTAWIYSRGLVKVIDSSFTNKQTVNAANSIIYLNCGSTRADDSLFDNNNFSLEQTSSDVAGVWVGQFDGKSCAASVTDNTFTNFATNTTDTEDEFAAIVDGSSDGVQISGNDFGDGEVTDPEEPGDGDVVAPYSLSAFSSVIDQSKLQRWDPTLSDGDKLEVKNSTIADDEYYDDYFYAYDGSEEMVFTMRGDSNRSELRVENNFDVTDVGYTMSASFQPIDIDEAIAVSVDGDEVTFLQVHNNSGDDYIPHPLLRVTYEETRDDLDGHYWAVIKTNALDCSSDSDDYGSADCNDSYERISLGEANLDAMTDIDISVGNSRLVITVEGEEKVDYDISYWGDLLSYFKAGVYNQYDVNGADYWSEARFSKLTVSENSEEPDPEPTTGWDIDEWKITIPASKDDWYGDGGTSAAEVVPAFCDDDSKDVLSDDADLVYKEYETDISFFNVIDGRMHFRTDMGYGTSTSNSSYIRSELRELFNAQALDTCSTSNDDRMTSWFIDDSATNTQTHKLTSVLRIEEYPSISGQDPKVVVGQVHGWEISQALVKVLWEGENKPVRVIMNQGFFTDNEKCDDDNPVNNCDEWSFSIELGTYAADVDWQYVIQVDEDGIYLATEDESGAVEKQINWGVAFQDKDGDSVTMSEDWAGNDIAYYFKAGIYPQFKPDSDNAGERFDVSFSTVNIEHK